MLRIFAIEILACLSLMVCVVQSTDAGVRIYGGPVSSAGSGKYYAPHGNLGTVRMSDRSDPNPEVVPVRIDLNPLFIPGNDFIAPGYVPKYFPRPSYLAYGYFGYHFGSAVEH